MKVNNYLDRVYDPSRVLYPMRRTGPKGSGQFERITWDDGARRDRRRASARSPTSTAPRRSCRCSYLGTQGILNGLNVGDPFFAKLGATVTERTYCDSGSCTAYAMTIGDTAGVDPESLVHSKFILVWACNIISTNLHLWPYIVEARKRGAKVVVVDPVRTRTAAAGRPAHRDPPRHRRRARAGDDARDHRRGPHRRGLRRQPHRRATTSSSSASQQYTPEWAEAETGVPADDIRTLAREYAAAQPSLIRIGVAVERHAGGGQTVRALSVPARRWSARGASPAAGSCSCRCGRSR